MLAFTSPIAVSESTYQVTITPRTKWLNKCRVWFIVSRIDRCMGWLCRHSPFPLLNKLVPPHYLYKNPTFRTVRWRGLKLHLNISDCMEHMAYFNVQDPFREKLYQLVQPGMQVIDIGANTGIAALLMATKAGSTGSVCAFEPDPINFQKAVQQASLNPTLDVKWINAGLAEKAGTAKLSNVNPGNRGMMRILPAQNEIGFQQTNIRLVPLDEWTAQQELQKIDLIKIDVEGYEMSVLKGAVATLSKFNPQLFIELDDDNLRSQGSSAQELLAFLHNHHYTCVHALTGLAISESSNLSHCHFDVMAEKKLSPKSETKS